MLLHQLSVHITVKAETEDDATHQLGELLTAESEKRDIIWDYSIEEVMESYPEPQQELPFDKPAVTDLEIVQAMERYGGSFVQALSKAFNCADGGNLLKLKKAFPQYWGEYAEIARLHKEQRGNK